MLVLSILLLAKIAEERCEVNKDIGNAGFLSDVVSDPIEKQNQSEPLTKGKPVSLAPLEINEDVLTLPETSLVKVVTKDQPDLFLLRGSDTSSHFSRSGNTAVASGYNWEQIVSHADNVTVLFDPRVEV